MGSVTAFARTVLSPDPPPFAFRRAGSYPPGTLPSVLLPTQVLEPKGNPLIRIRAEFGDLAQLREDLVEVTPPKCEKTGPMIDATDRTGEENRHCLARMSGMILEREGAQNMLRRSGLR